MKRLSIVTLSVLLPFVALAAPGCSSDSSPDDSNTSAGTGSTTAGTGGTLAPVAGTGNNLAGTGTGGTTNNAAGAGTGGTTAGTAAGGGGAGGAAAGTASGGSSTSGAGGASTAGAGGGTPNPSCPLKIDSMTDCTAVATCADVYCGVFKLGSKDCSCEAASGKFKCLSCDYAGKTEEIVVPPSAALTACAADDATLEATTGCTKGMRCRSTDAAKVRFCACWDDPVDGGTVWDCDALPSSWPK